VKLKILLPLLLIIVSSMYFNNLISEIRFKKEEERRKIRTLQALVKPLYLNLDDTSRSITLQEVGVNYDMENDVISINNVVLEKYFSELESEYDYMSKNTIISLEEYSFRTPSEKARIKIDRTKIGDKYFISDLIEQGDFKLKVELDTVDDPELQLKRTEEIVYKMSGPLLVKYGRQPVTIPADTVRSFIDIVQEGQVYKGTVSDTSVSDYLNSLHEKYASPSVVVNHQYSVDFVRRAILYRATDYQVNNALILPLEGRPVSNGEKHDVYLEVIKSQQRLYRFEQGKLVKTYIISTGLTWETPPGDYKILGKDRMAMSYTGNWYMPHYLPIGLIKGQYRFGFHAIPYHMDGAGNIYSRDPNTMGSPATGGCIQLTPEEAEELFNWARIGIPVYIYE
jgi:lipoprotein-anchoring transpeptidase ErfK/SrfK